MKVKKANAKVAVQIIPAKTFQIKKNHKYLIIMPADHVEKIGTELSTALKTFFGGSKVLVIGAKDLDKIKIAEVFNE